MWNLPKVSTLFGYDLQSDVEHRPGVANNAPASREQQVEMRFDSSSTVSKS
jgi:hypothetical protein